MKTFKQHKYQWLISALIILVAIGLGTAIYKTQKPPATTNTSDHEIKTHYAEWQAAYLRGQHSKYVLTTSTGKPQTLSEAQGYGMLITVMAANHQLATQRTFNQLTRYYLAHRLSVANPLMAWRQTEKNGQMQSASNERTSATDGDLDIAYALILADQQWGSRGQYNYRRLAKQLISAIKTHEINATTHLPLVGEWATTASTVNLVRPSDLMTAYFRKFASYTHDGSWTRVAQNSQTALQKLSAAHATGLMADFVTVSGTKLKLGMVHAKQVASAHDNQYAYNACRIPWRVAYDYQLSESRTSKKIVQKMLTFFTRQNKITAIYTLNGKAVTKTANQAFTTPIVYAAQATGNQVLTKRYPTALSTKIETHNYYPATIHMLMLVMSGEIGK
ncbi:glycosyl hydrolase family 8 [Lactiplantibacillus fabifermentans]|uniref:Glucanase n=2 Tax=Lactiplantibacillus fabifermentans TaxID=483011 RepID=A0A0R2NCB0_9LACO|nr:glycosyl hydrolase family 8 [Lactiplantibacillus fabifermentans]ETY72642.1 endoglucanase [Lactiplantibacillus fabifermentans T30PCM01]KRO23528.1 endoglucanase Y [Lactiplantibacillus fabifermentans DSM 21115]